MYFDFLDALHSVSSFDISNTILYLYYEEGAKRLIVESMTTRRMQKLTPLMGGMPEDVR